MNTQQLLIFALVAIAAGAGFYAIAAPAASTRATKRQKSIYNSQNPGARLQVTAARDAATRRSQITESLKELEKRQVNLRNPPLRMRIDQAGLGWSKQRFYVISLIMGLVFGLLGFLLTFSPIVGVLALFAGGLGAPRWLLRYLTKKRQKNFIKEFPNSIDIIVRGVKSGLPLGDCIRIVASEAQEPVRSEFRAIMETQAVGMPLGEAVERLYSRIGLAEANFFSIVIAIQSKAGGNLSEALSNLARVLRERQKMRGKIQAMSMEAKASAAIIGALPILVGLGVYITSPDYIAMLWQNNIGLVMIGASAFWMLCGILVMRQMINFDF